MGRRVRSSPRLGKPATWQRDPARSQNGYWNARRSPVNTGAPWPSLDEAETRVLEIQTKLHRWAKDAPDRQFNDLYNLVCDPAILVVAWSRVRSNRGARSAGIDKVEPRSIQPPRTRDSTRAARSGVGWRPVGGSRRHLAER